MSDYKKIYAVDFDGTLAKTKFPEIIHPNIPIFMMCKQLKRKGAILILWTCRYGKDLEDAVEYCKKYGLEFDYINENVPENVERWGGDSRKIYAHEYIDDKAWSPIREKKWRECTVKAYMNGIYTSRIVISLLAISGFVCLVLEVFGMI